MKKIETSIIIVNYNGKKYTEKCISSVLKTKNKNIEIIIIDNGSTDNSANYLQKKFGNKIAINKLTKNFGPAMARNIGIKKSRGEYLAFLDNDTQVDKNFLKQPLKEFKKDKKVGIIQSKLLLFKNKKQIDYVGEYMGFNGFLIQSAKTGEIDKGQYNKKTFILAAKSAAMFLRKKILKKTGNFDKDYFIYMEETDLGIRSWLCGFKNIYCPESVVYHQLGTSSIILGKNKNNFNSKFHGSKNYICTLIKNFEIKTLLIILPIHVISWIGLSFYALFNKDIKSFFWIFLGILWNIIYLPFTLYKRFLLQKNRTIYDKELFPIIFKKVPFSYFLKKAFSRHKIGNIEGFIKK